MSSLAEVYEGRVGEYASLRRLYLGVGAFSFGALLVVAGIVIAASGLATGGLGWTLAQARETAGILAGLGLPATFLGVLAIMPTSRRTKATAVVGAGVAVLGVALFSHAYPCHWSGARCVGEFSDLTLPTTGVYFLGAFTTFWCLFTGVANFKARNNPGGTVSLEITREGETRVIEVPRSQVEDVTGAKGSIGSAGGVGLLGATPDGSVETQTNRPGQRERRREASGQGSTGRTNAGSTSRTGRSRPTDGAGTASDGGAAETADITPLRDENTGTESPGSGSSGPAGPAGPSGRSPAGTGSVGAGSTETGSSGAGPSGTGSSGTAGSGRGGRGGRAESAGDTYCGSCGHFQYVRTDTGMQPYCGLHDDLMDDMDACDDWSPR